eukprot:15467095-Alexandrium_andersonii.AAC.1
MFGGARAVAVPARVIVVLGRAALLAQVVERGREVAGEDLARAVNHDDQRILSLPGGQRAASGPDAP